MENAYEKFYSEQEDVLDWTKEANGVIQDIIRHVQEALLSDRFKATDCEAYINLRTLEGTEACVKLNGEGLQIVGNGFDCIDRDGQLDNERYETPYSLLSSLSPSYVQSFGNCLADALSKQIQKQLVGNGAQEDVNEQN